MSEVLVCRIVCCKGCLKYCSHIVYVYLTDQAQLETKHLKILSLQPLKQAGLLKMVQQCYSHQGFTFRVFKTERYSTLFSFKLFPLKLQCARTYFKPITVVWDPVSIPAISQRSSGPFVYSSIFLLFMIVHSNLGIKKSLNVSSSLRVDSECTSSATSSSTSLILILMKSWNFLLRVQNCLLVDLVAGLSKKQIS